MPGKFELYKDVGGRFRFRLTGENGERVLVSDGYAKKVLALEAIVSVLKMAPEATLIDLTVSGNGEFLLTDDDSAEESLKPVSAAGVKATPRKRAPAKKRTTKKAAAVSGRKQTGKGTATSSPNAEKTEKMAPSNKKKRSKKSKKEKKRKAKNKKKH